MKDKTIGLALGAGVIFFFGCLIMTVYFFVVLMDASKIACKEYGNKHEVYSFAKLLGGCMVRYDGEIISYKEHQFIIKLNR